MSCNLSHKKNSDSLDYAEKGKDFFYEIFSNGFKNFLVRKNFSTQTIAKKLGVTDSAVSSWKYGRAFPDICNLYKLFSLGLSPFEIMDRSLEENVRKNDIEYRDWQKQKLIKFVKDLSIRDDTLLELLKHETLFNSKGV